jgi:hypothetical protein
MQGALCDPDHQYDSYETPYRFETLTELKKTLMEE